MTGGSTKRAPEKQRLLHLLRLLVIAVVAVVSAGVASPKRDVASVVASTRLTARVAPHAVRRASVPRWSHQWQAGVVRPVGRVVDRFAVDAELEDDDVARNDLATPSAAALDGASFPRKPARPSTHEPQIDTLRFAIGRGLPRAPPT